MDAALATLRGGCGSPAAEAAVLQALALLLQQASTSHTTLPAAVTQAVAQVCLQNTDAPRLVRVLGYDLLLCTGFANTAAWTALSRAAIFDVSADVGYGTYQHTPLHMVMVACMCAVSVKLSQFGLLWRWLLFTIWFGPDDVLLAALRALASLPAEHLLGLIRTPEIERKLVALLKPERSVVVRTAATRHLGQVRASFAHHMRKRR